MSWNSDTENVDNWSYTSALLASTHNVQRHRRRTLSVTTTKFRSIVNCQSFIFRHHKRYEVHRVPSLFWHSIMSLEWIKARAWVTHHGWRDDGATPEVRGRRLPLLLLLHQQVRQARLPQATRSLALAQLVHTSSPSKKNNLIVRRARSLGRQWNWKE